MWAAGVIILEQYAGSLKTLKAGHGDNAPALLETLSQKNKTRSGDSSRSVQSSSPIDSGTGKSLHFRESDGGGTTVYEGDMVGTVGREEELTVDGKRKSCPIDMPNDVLSVLRELLTTEPRARPASMEVTEEIA